MQLGEGWRRVRRVAVDWGWHDGGRSFGVVVVCGIVRDHFGPESLGLTGTAGRNSPCGGLELCSSLTPLTHIRTQEFGASRRRGDRHGYESSYGSATAACHCHWWRL